MKAVICGCGVAGLGVARSLADAGWEVLALDRGALPRGGAYAIDLWGPGFDVVETLGLLPDLRRRALPIEEVSFVDSKGHSVAALDYGQLREATRGRLVTVLRGDLEEVLGAALPGQIDLRSSCTVDDFQPTEHGVDVTLSDNSRHVVDLLVGADGLHSQTRERAFGTSGAVLRHLGLHVAAYTFMDAALSAFVGHRFWATDTVGRLFVLYGLPHDRVGVLAVHRSTDREPPADPQATMRECYGDLGLHVATALEHCPDRPLLFYESAVQIEMPRWSTGRVVLAGDACHAVSLVAGQGASLALAGAWALVHAIRETPDVDAAIGMYERRMRPLVLAGQAKGRRTAAWFAPATRSHLTARRLALRLLQLRWLGPRLLPAIFLGDRRVQGR